MKITIFAQCVFSVAVTFSIHGVTGHHTQYGVTNPALSQNVQYSAPMIMTPSFRPQISSFAPSPPIMMTPQKSVSQYPYQNGITMIKENNNGNSVFNVKVISQNTPTLVTGNNWNNQPNIQYGIGQPSTQQNVQFSIGTAGNAPGASSMTSSMPSSTSSPSASNSNSASDIIKDPDFSFASLANTNNQGAGHPFVATYNIGSFQGLKIEHANKILSQNNGINNSPDSKAESLTVNNGIGNTGFSTNRN